MITTIPLLQNARVASPCDASWEEMAAIDGERVKFCGGCKKNVYNLSAMSQGEAEGLLRRHEGRLCIRYYQRHDGTILSGDCSVGAQAIRMAMIRRSVVAAGLFAMLFSAMAAVNISQMHTTGDLAPLAVTTIETPSVTPELPVAVPTTTPEPEARPMMGAMASIPAPTEPPMRTEMDKVRIGGRSAYTVPIEIDPVQSRLAVPVNATTPGQQLATPEKDTTDEAILKPHAADSTDK